MLYSRLLVVGLVFGVVFSSRGEEVVDSETKNKAEAMPKLGLVQVTPGNVFLTTDKPTVKVKTTGDSVEWQAWDMDHQEVAKGTVPVEQGGASIDVPRKNGYFLVQVKASKGGVALAEAYTSYCVMPPYQVKDRGKAPWGAMTHFAQGMSTDLLPILAKAGIVSIRDEHYWAQVERKKGKYVFPEKSAKYMAEVAKYDIDPLIAMTFGNKLYDHKDGPSTPAGFEGYGNYGQAILKEYGKQIKWLEIWNEYNGSWAPPVARKSLKSRYTTYTGMLKAAYEKIKVIRPDVKVLGCACVLIPIPYIEGIFKLGGLNYMDGVVIHPYRGQPEGVDREVAELRDLMRKYSNGKEKEIWVTETGRHGKVEYDWERGKGMYEKGRNAGAVYLPRQYTLLLSQNVTKIYWYLSSDHLNFVSMGLLRHADNPMGRFAVCPSYVTYATLIRQLDGTKFIEREAASKYTRAYVMKFRNSASEDVRVCWATYPSKIELSTDEPVTSISMVGEERGLKPVNGIITVDLSEKVCYLKGKIKSVREMEPAVKIIASTSDDYGKTQGLNDWSYGYFDVKKGQRSEFKQMKVVETMWGEDWAGPHKYMKLGRDVGHPGNNAWVVRRWKSSYTGKVRISGHCRRGKKGDGIEFVILKDGKSISATKVGGKHPTTAQVEVDVNVTDGTTIDICVAPNGGISYDATSYELMFKAGK